MHTEDMYSDSVMNKCCDEVAAHLFQNSHPHRLRGVFKQLHHLHDNHKYEPVVCAAPSQISKAGDNCNTSTTVKEAFDPHTTQQDGIYVYIYPKSAQNVTFYKLPLWEKLKQVIIELLQQIIPVQLSLSTCSCLNQMWGGAAGRLVAAVGLVGCKHVRQFPLEEEILTDIWQKGWSNGEIGKRGRGGEERGESTVRGRKGGRDGGAGCGERAVRKGGREKAIDTLITHQSAANQRAEHTQVSSVHWGWRLLKTSTIVL